MVAWRLFREAIAHCWYLPVLLRQAPNQTLPGEQAIGHQSVVGFGAIVMSDFSQLSIFKSQAKQIVRDQDVKLSAVQETLAQKAGFANYHELSVVAQRSPNDPRLMVAFFGVKDFSDAIYESDIHADLDLELEDQLSGAIAETNASGFTIDALTVDTTEYADSTGILILGVSLTYQDQQDQERVYHGAAFFLTATVELLRREGKWLLAEDGVSISSIESDADRDRRSEQEYWLRWKRIETATACPWRKHSRARWGYRSRTASSWPDQRSRPTNRMMGLCTTTGSILNRKPKVS